MSTKACKEGREVKPKTPQRTRKDDRGKR